MFSPYSNDRKNAEKIKSQGVTVHPMEKKTIGSSTLYYTSVNGLGNDVKIIGIMKNGKLDDAVVAMDDEPVTLELLEDSDHMHVKTYLTMFEDLIPQLDEDDDKHQKLIERFNNLPDSLKNKRMYYMRYMYFDGETHEFLGSDDEVGYDKIVDNMIEALMHKSSTGGSKTRRSRKGKSKKSKKSKKARKGKSKKGKSRK